MIKQTKNHCVIFFINCVLVVLLSFSDGKIQLLESHKVVLKKIKRLSLPTLHPIAVILAKENLQLYSGKGKCKNKPKIRK